MKDVVEFEKFMHKQILALDSVDIIKEAMAYSLISNGKYIRPLVFLRLINKQKISTTDCYKIMMAIECIHAYSLIHDDLPSMDDDDYRRGKLTSHKVYGEDIAILAGDALNTYAFELLSTLDIDSVKVISLINILARHAGVNNGMVNGQVLDIKSPSDVDLEYLKNIHIQKTARLLQVPLLFAVILNDEPKLYDKAYELGLHVGICYQIQDDYLDLYGDEQLVGKPIGSDRDNDKKTYVDFYDQIQLRNLIDEYQNSISKLAFELSDNQEFRSLISNLAKRSS